MFAARRRLSHLFVSRLGALAALAACTPYQPRALPEQPVDAAAAPPVVIVPEPDQLDPHAAAPASVSGTIRDAAGRPLGSAWACVWNMDRHVRDSAPRCVETDAEGAYELAGLLPTRHELHAGAPGQQPIAHPEPLSLRPGERRRGVEIQLAPGGVQLRGIVRDLQGQPVAGAWVTNFDREIREQGGLRGGAAASRTDASGSFTLWVSPGSHTLIAGAVGAARSRLTGAHAPGRHTLELGPESVIIGEVVDATSGAPVAGARVTALAERPDSAQHSGVAYTDAAGQYRITGLVPGLYRPRAEAPGRRGVGGRAVYLAQAATSSPQTISLRPAASVSGRIVVAGADRACPGGRVMLHGESGVQIELAGPEGEVFFAAVPPGPHEVTVQCPDGVAPPSLPRLEIGAAPLRGVAWEVAAGRAIRGVLVDPQGRPIVGAQIRAFVRNPRTSLPGQGGCVADDGCAMDEICDNGVCVFSGVAMASSETALSHTSDGAGRFILAGLPAGHYQLARETSSPGTSPTVVELAADRDAEDVRVVAAAWGTLAGAVVDRAGAPVVGVAVEVLADRGKHLVPTGGARTDDEGRFAVFDLKPGDYRVRLTAGDGGPQDPRPGDVRARVTSDAPAEVTLTQLAPLAQIRGRVRGPDGAPISGVMIGACLEGQDDIGTHERLRYGAADRTAVPDATGAFTLTSLAAGSYSLRAHLGGDVGEVVVEHVAAGSDVTLTVPPPRSIAGRISGATPDSFQLQLHRHDGGLVRVETFEHTGGRWAVEGLTPGTYEIYADAGAQRGVLVVTVAGDSLESLDLKVATPAGLRGRVLDAGTRSPLAGVEVSIHPEGPALRFGSWPVDVMTDDDGRFEVQGLPPGRSTVSFPGYEPASLESTLESGRTAEVWPVLRLAPLPAARPR